MPTSNPPVPPTRRRGVAPRLTATAVLVALVLAAGACTKSNDPQTSTANPPTQGTTSSGGATFALPPDPGAAIKQAGLPELPAEGRVVHHHAHLEVNINGQNVTVPANIGITPKSISPLHTHDDTGILHIEAENPDTITLGQLFTEWGVKLDKTCVGTYCTDDKNQMLGFVNGQLVPDPASIPITEHAVIYIWYGPRGTNPTAPTTYDFAKQGL